MRPTLNMLMNTYGDPGPDPDAGPGADPDPDPDPEFGRHAVLVGRGFPGSGVRWGTGGGGGEVVMAGGGWEIKGAQAKEVTNRVEPSPAPSPNPPHATDPHPPGSPPCPPPLPYPTPAISISTLHQWQLPPFTHDQGPPLTHDQDPPHTPVTRPPPPLTRDQVCPHVRQGGPVKVEVGVKQAGVHPLQGHRAQGTGTSRARAQVHQGHRAQVHQGPGHRAQVFTPCMDQAGRQGHRFQGLRGWGAGARVWGGG